jgi:hypothetical protein
LTIKFNDNANINPLIIENSYGLGFGVGLLFNLGYDGTGSSVGTSINGGRIFINPETTWTSTASTQDASMIFYTAQNGVLGDGLKIASDKVVTLYGALIGSSATFSINSASTSQLTLSNTNGSATQQMHMGAFAGNAYFSTNWYYNGAAAYDDNTKKSSSIVLNGDGSINFNTSDTANTAPNTRLTISSTGSATFSSSVNVNNASTLSVYRADNTRALQLYTTNNECVIDSWQASSEPLHIRSMGSGGRIVFFTNSAERLRITSDGNVGINATDPVKTLDVRGTLAISNNAGSYWYMDRDDSDGRFKILTDANSEKFSIATSGAATFSSSVTTNANEGFIINPSSGNSYASYKIGGTTYGYVGVAGSAGSIITGSATGDVIVRSASKSILFSVNDGSSAALKLTASTGVATFSSSVLTNSPSEGATGEGLIAGRSFKIDATGTGQTAKMYMVSNSLSNTYGSGLVMQFANFAGNVAAGFNLIDAGSFETYIKNSGGSFVRAMTITNSANIGIGTNSPSTLLHLNATSTQLTLQNVNGGVDAERIGMFMTGSDTFKIISLNDNNTTRVDNIIVANVLNGNIGIGTGSPVSVGLTGALTIFKTASADTPTSTTAQNYYVNQSGLYLFGRNSGLTLISNNSEDGHIIFANASTTAYARIGTNSGTSSVGGDMYFYVGSDQERFRITTTGWLLIKNVPSTPSSNPSGGGYLFVDSGRLYFRGSSGTITLIANA